MRCLIIAERPPPGRSLGGSADRRSCEPGGRLRHAPIPDACEQARPYRFYLEPEGTVLAIHEHVFRRTTSGKTFEGFGGLYERHNSPVVWMSASEAYLLLCQRISEAEARRRHPALFERLDAETSPN
jgi:hypothetical protein